MLEIYHCVKHLRYIKYVYLLNPITENTFLIFRFVCLYMYIHIPTPVTQLGHICDSSLFLAFISSMLLGQ